MSDLTVVGRINEQGSVLMEQLVALALLSLMAVSVFSLLTTGSLAVRLAHSHSLAAGLAAQRLESVSEPCEGPAADSSRWPVDPTRFPGYEWRLEMTEVASGLCQAKVTVWWPQRGRMRNLSLTTLVRREDEP